MGLFGNNFESVAKEISQEIYEFSAITVRKFNELSQNPNEDEDIYKKWEKANSEDVEIKLIHEFQIFLLYSLSCQAANILEESKHKKFMDIAIESTIKRTPKISEDIVAKRYSEYTNYELIPLNENLEFAPEEVENTALGRFTYYLSNILEVKVDPMLDGMYLFSAVNQFAEVRNIEKRLSEL